MIAKYKVQSLNHKLLANYYWKLQYFSLENYKLALK